MAKKKARKKAVKAKKTRPAKAAPRPEPEPNVVIFYELSGVAGIRYYDEFADLNRARLAARALVASPDVMQAWIIQGLEIIRKPSR